MKNFLMLFLFVFINVSWATPWLPGGMASPFLGNFTGEYVGECQVEIPGYGAPIDDCEIVITVEHNGSVLESIGIAPVVYGMEIGPLGMSEHLIQGEDLIDPIDDALVGKINSRSFYLTRPELGIFRLSHLFGKRFELYIESRGVIELGPFMPDEFVFKATVVLQN